VGTITALRSAGEQALRDDPPIPCSDPGAIGALAALDNQLSRVPAENRCGDRLQRDGTPAKEGAAASELLARAGTTIKPRSGFVSYPHEVLMRVVKTVPFRQTLLGHRYVFLAVYESRRPRRLHPARSRRARGRREPAPVRTHSEERRLAEAAPLWCLSRGRMPPERDAVGGRLGQGGVTGYGGRSLIPDTLMEPGPKSGGCPNEPLGMLKIVVKLSAARLTESGR
jgi:hypothetical protein